LFPRLFESFVPNNAFSGEESALDFPIVEVPIIGGRILIAITGIVHVLISHGCAVGGSLFIVLLEYKSIRENNPRLNKLAYRIARWFFILTTSVGALTGVGIWFTTNMFAPAGIGSLLRIFFWVWFLEWIVFFIEIVLVSIYYLSWNRISSKKHLYVGIAYTVMSAMTMVIIVGILGFQLTSGRWADTASFWDAFFNPTYIPQLFSRMTLAALLGCGFSLIIFSLLKGFDSVRREFLGFSGLLLMITSPIYLLATLSYYQTLPERAEKFISVALVTLQFEQYANWSKIFFFVVVVILFLAGLILFFKRKTYGILSVAPMLLLILATAQFARVREFVRKPYVINKYMYSNGIREAEVPFLSKVGMARYETWAWRGTETDEGDKALGHMLFRRQCSVCHTYRGINGIFKKRPVLSGEEVMLGFLDSYSFSHPYMPPFAGTQKEKAALAKFLTEGAKEE
jgi:cytochrome bd-type quinol oxidase subunit 1